MTLSSKPKRAQFAYIYYGSETHNWRRLEEYVEKDNEGSVVSSRKKDRTSSNAKNYAWKIY